MPPSHPPPSPRATYHAFIDKFFPDDSRLIKPALERAVDGAALRARVEPDAVWQALCSGIEEWEKQRLLSMIAKGTALQQRQAWRGPGDDPASEPKGFHWSWLLNRKSMEVEKEHEHAIEHVQELEDWAKKFSAGQHDDALARLRRDIQRAIEEFKKFKAQSGRPAGRNWGGWPAAMARLAEVGVEDASDLRKLRDASALGRPDPNLPA